MGKRNRKATNITVTQNFLKQRTEFLKANDWPKSKWIYFCEEMMRLGFTVELYEARQTKSKYCTVKRDGRTFKVRFSDHKPIYHREIAGDCDFFVGWTHTGVRNTHDAVHAVCNFFGVQRIAGVPNPKTCHGVLVDFV